AGRPTAPAGASRLAARGRGRDGERASLRPARDARDASGHLPSNTPAPVDRDDPARQIAIADPGETRRAYDMRERLLVGEGADALDEVAIRRAIAGDDFSHRRDRRHGIGLVKHIEAGHVDMRKFKRLELATRFQNPEGLGERPVDMRNIADPEGDR